MKSTKEITIAFLNPKEVQGHNDTLLIDVRTAAEFNAVHIDGSVLQPLDSLSPDQIESLASGKKHCILICGSGMRAQKAAKKLCRCNLPDLQILRGGIQAWDAEGLPLNRGTSFIALDGQVRLFVGSLIILGAVLGYFINPAWVILSGIMGLGLIFVGLTGKCPMATALAKMPWNTHASGSSCKPSSQ